MTRAIMQQALDFCVFCWRDVDMNDYAFERLETTIDALRTELAKPEPEPVAYAWVDRHGLHMLTLYDPADYELANQITPLFTKEQL